MNNNFSFDEWFTKVIPTYSAVDRTTVREWLVANEFNTFEALLGLEERHMPVEWSTGRKAAIYASRPGVIADHPSAPQGLGLSQPTFILQDGARYDLKEPPASKFQHVIFILLYYAFCFY